ncbi:MAG: DUF503 domain-containing protein [Dehalococcoidia bacterium]|nr:DUF503 domain-containing protein [Dehalococcoidia bacterium]
MKVGVCRVEVHLPESQSLKDKRRIIKSIISRLQNEYHISVAEVENQGLWQIATIGIACVSNHSQHADEILASALNFITRNYPQVEVINYETEIINVF